MLELVKGYRKRTGYHERTGLTKTVLVIRYCTNRDLCDL